MEKMRFIELLHNGEELNCDLIIGDVDMPASFVWDNDCLITDYGVEKYWPIMDAECVRLENGNIEILCDDYKLGEEFCLATAGHISAEEYNKLFLSVE